MCRNGVQGHLRATKNSLSPVRSLSLRVTVGLDVQGEIFVISQGARCPYLHEAYANEPESGSRGPVIDQAGLSKRGIFMLDLRSCLPTQLPEDCHAVPWRHLTSSQALDESSEIGAQFQGPVRPIRPAELGPHGNLPRKSTSLALLVLGGHCIWSLEQRATTTACDRPPLYYIMVRAQNTCYYGMMSTLSRSHAQTNIGVYGAKSSSDL